MLLVNVFILLAIIFSAVLISGSISLAAKDIVSYLKEKDQQPNSREKVSEMQNTYQDIAINDTIRRIDEANKEIAKLWDWVHGDDWDGENWKEQKPTS